MMVAMSSPVPPPVPKTVPTTRAHHGEVVTDDLAWLGDEEDPDTIAYLEAQNAHTEALTEHLGPLREAIFDEIKSRTLETDMSVATRIGDWWYFTRTQAGEQYGAHCRAPVASPEDWTPPQVSPDAALPGEMVLLDGNERAQGHEFYSLGAYEVSHDGRLLAFSEDVKGDERYDLRVKDLATGELLADELTGVAPGAVWSLDGHYLFYQRVDEAWRPDSVWRHRLGDDSANDVRVYHEPDERYWVGVGSSRSERWLFIASSSKATSEMWALDSSDPTGAFQVVAERREGVEYEVEHAVVDGTDVFLILHNDEAENFALAQVPASDPARWGREHWTSVLEHDPALRLEGVDAFDGYLALSYRREGLPKFAVCAYGDSVRPADQAAPAEAFSFGEFHGGQFQELAFSEQLVAAGLGANPEWASPRLRFGRSSFTTPAQVYDLDVPTGERILLKTQPVLGDFDPSQYEAYRLWAVADDGAQVPISVVRKRSVAKPAPTLLYGYGAYESSIDPGFSVARLSLLDRGVVFALAHVRGGGELGRHWYEQGRFTAKPNTFTDFIACAKALVDQGETAPGRLVAEGGSAGGWLVGAAANLAPELFAGVLAVVPFVDPLTTILDPSLPLTVTEWEEWGNPLEDKAVYDYMKAYSPYENVTAKAYPKILAICSLNDTRVRFAEPAKWVARLQQATTSGEPVLLKTEMNAGHGGRSGRYERWKEAAFEQAWILDVLGARV
ncbi:Oligopeptidase B [Segniliparus rotundus DSM 44985]|uniref:Oligopeptidase B n=2 Tax=Segniliparus rotundus TaxID=286802 RepID=D6ZA65_SEGRD|nr:Oligopeptidase B [Segniliparus rotundus DSM 44985]